MECSKGVQTINREITHITEEDVKVILSNCSSHNERTLQTFEVHYASDKMLGFMADYYKLNIVVTEKNNGRRILSFFIKAVSRSNASKAQMLKEMNLFEKEFNFYKNIKKELDVSGLKPWSAKFITGLDDAIIFQDLNALHYKLRNKFERFDMAHTIQALRTLARFHASSIIFEENRKIMLRKPYAITDEYQLLDKAGYSNSNSWYIQCKSGALEAIRTFSKYSKNSFALNVIESRWDDIWSAALQLCELPSKDRSVICHRDLWNNNILFHYEKVGEALEPDDCVFVDFQGVRYQPLAGDIMFLLYCNLEPKFREENLADFLNYYYQELGMILCGFGISIDDLLHKEEFLASVERHRLWGLVAWACLIPLVWISDELTTSIFSDSANFAEILSKDKATFIKKMMHANEDYKDNLLTVFEEIVERYCL